MNDFIFLDLETTGFSAEKDDVLEVSLIDNNGDPLLLTLCRPTKKTEWPHAQEIHGITPEMVAGKMTWDFILKDVMDLCIDREVVIYNKNFDIKFCPGLEAVARSVHCCMVRFAEHYGERKANGSIKWQKLVRAAALTGFDWGGLDSHRALSDTLATRHVWNHLEEKENA